MDSEVRLIDANALRKKAVHAKIYSPEMLVVGLGYVLDAPTVDPVRHGRWIIRYDRYGHRQLYCSECKEHSGLSREKPYCPNCGARMDGEATGWTE